MLDLVLNAILVRRLGAPSRCQCSPFLGAEQAARPAPGRSDHLDAGREVGQARAGRGRAVRHPPGAAGHGPPQQPVRARGGGWLAAVWVPNHPAPGLPALALAGLTRHGRYFSFLVKAREEERYVCHSFVCGNATQASEVSDALGRAFSLAHKLQKVRHAPLFGGGPLRSRPGGRDSCPSFFGPPFPTGASR